MEEKLTLRQQQILTFVTGIYRQTGQPPSFREIGRRFKIRSTNGVRDHLKALERKGYLSVMARPRGIELPETLRERVFGVPLLGRVPAGRPILAEENFEELVTLPMYFGGEGLIGLRVKGDSMVGAGIQEGDVVVVRVQSKVESGEIGVVWVDGEVTVKRLQDCGSALRLVPENPKYVPVEVQKKEGIRVVGKVVGLVRRL